MDVLLNLRFWLLDQKLQRQILVIIKVSRIMWIDKKRLGRKNREFLKLLIMISIKMEIVKEIEILRILGKVIKYKIRIFLKKILKY